MEGKTEQSLLAIETHIAADVENNRVVSIVSDDSTALLHHKVVSPTRICHEQHGCVETSSCFHEHQRHIVRR